MHQEVNTYLNNLKKWKKELTSLRELILACGLKEEFKWKHPCYTDNRKNILIIHGFKDYCGISFFKGVLLKDPEKILIRQTENVQSARQLRFTNLQEITDLKPVIKKYIKEAIEIEKSDIKIIKKITADFIVPTEVEQTFKDDPDYKKAFNNLTPGRQRGYLLYFSQAKQAKTKLSRIEKKRARIIDGYGLNDCTCGLSKRKPNCDGSHKQLLAT